MFWNRLRQSKPKFHAFSYGFRRCYNLNPVPIVANQHISTRTLFPILNNPKFIVHDSQLEFLHNVRFYAKHVKASKKKEITEPSGPRLNDDITAPTIRLVTDEEHFVISRYEALARARNLDLDLVEVDRTANPPVCKIFDYNKEKYRHQTKEKERAKSKDKLKPGCKEVRFAAKIKQNDLKIKADAVKRLLDNCHRVKCTAIEPTADVDLKSLLSRFTALIKDVATFESAPKYEKKQAFVVVRHVKFDSAKKGSGKKASKNKGGSGSERVDSDENSEEDVQTNESEWVVFGRDDDAHSMFDINNEAKHEQSRAAVEPAQTNTASSTPVGTPKPVMENRYARDPRSATPPRIPTDVNSRGARNTINSVPPMPNQGYTSPQMRPSRQVEVPAYEVPKQDSSCSGNPSSPPKSYGIFSSRQVNTTPNEQNAPAANNRYAKNTPPDSARSPRTTGASPQRNFPSGSGVR